MKLRITQKAPILLLLINMNKILRSWIEEYQVLHMEGNPQKQVRLRSSPQRWKVWKVPQYSKLTCQYFVHRDSRKYDNSYILLSNQILPWQTLTSRAIWHPLHLLLILHYFYRFSDSMWGTGSISVWKHLTDLDTEPRIQGMSVRSFPQEFSWMWQSLSTCVSTAMYRCRYPFVLISPPPPRLFKVCLHMEKYSPWARG